MTIQFADHVQCTTVTTGTGTITLGAATTGFQSFAQAVTNGQLSTVATISYTIVDGVNWESGIGLFTNSTSTLTRFVAASSSGNAALISLSGAGVVSLTLVSPFAIAANVAAPQNTPTLTGTVAITGTLTLTNTTSNTVVFANAGAAPPSFGTASLGEKILLRAAESTTSTDYAIGVDTLSLWYGLPAYGAGTAFAWYGGTTTGASLSDLGIFKAASIDNTAIGVANPSIWVATRQGLFLDNWIAIAWGGGSFVAVANNSTGSIVSNDGYNWTQNSLPVIANWVDIVYGNGLFVSIAAGSAIIATSPNGITWTQHTLPVSGNWISITFGNNLFVAVVQNSTVAITSPDGITWTQQALPISASWQQVYFANGLYLLIASSSSILLQSLNATTWTQITLPSALTWSAIAYGAGLYVIFAQNSSSIITSPDGNTWTTRTLPVSLNWVSVTYGNGLFVAISNGSNSAVSSSDGITWTATGSIGSIGTTNLLNVIYGSGIYVAVAPNLIAPQKAVVVYSLGPAAGTFSSLIAPTRPSGDYSTNAATTEFATPAFGNIGRNRLYNSLLRVQQRGTSFSVQGYTADRWYVNSTGTPTITCNKITGYGPASTILSVSQTTAASSDVITILQRLSLLDITPLIGKTMVLSCYSSATLSAGSCAIQLSISTPTTADNWTSQTTAATSGSIPISSTPTRVQWSFTVPTSASNGMAVGFQSVIAAGSGVMSFNASSFQLEVGSNASSVEIKALAHDYVECYYYYRTLILSAQGPATAAYQMFDSSVNWAPMRVTPTVALSTVGVSTPVSPNNPSASFIIISDQDGRFEITSAQSGQCSVVGQVYSLNSEL